MRIGIITFQYAWNYGAAIQCAALARALQAMGCAVQVIDYVPGYAQQDAVIQNPFLKAREGFLVGWHAGKGEAVRSAIRWFLGGCRSWLSIPARRAAYNGFRGFLSNQCRLTARYGSLKRLRAHPPACDVYVCGSDQIWNPVYSRHAPDPAYFLDFGPADARRIAYAASACKLDVAAHAEALRRMIGRIDAVSLREAEKKAEIEALTGRTVAVCLDPTLLLSTPDYGPMEEKIHEKPGAYVALYALGGADDPGRSLAYYAARKASGVMGLPVVDLSPKRSSGATGFMERRNVSPGAFLSYIKNAALVVTNSFHGTVFSIVYHRNFLAASRERMSSRIVELLQNLGVSNRMPADERAVDQLLENDCAIDWTDVEGRLENLRGESREFLRRSLEDRACR